MRNKEEKEEYIEGDPTGKDNIFPGTNKVTIQAGDIIIGIESQDENTERICDLAMNMIGSLLGVGGSGGVGPAKPSQPGEIDSDLDGMKEYEKLMDGIK